VALLEHHPRRHDTRPPPSFTSDHRRQPPLAVEGGKQVLEVRQFTLEFDNQQGLALSVPREQVDRPALAVHGERRLGDELPAHETAQARREPFLHGGVTLVEKARDLAAAPAKIDRDPSLECGRDPTGPLDPHSIHMPTLDP